MSGNNTKGMMATAGIGIASVIHQEIIKTATASTLSAGVSKEKGLKRRTAIKKRGPIINDNEERKLIFFSCFKIFLLLKIVI
jgi:hypothetical protein